MSRKLNRRGVALLIVLLVTALLLALVFEFAYATRISLNNAINFRDSQRAYFLARSGVHVFAKYKDLQKMQPQGVWGDLSPYLGSEDTKVMMKWEDEQGKINVKMIRKVSSGPQTPPLTWMIQLFTNKSIDQDILDKICDNQMTFLLPTEMHQVMSDEEFAKIEPFVTTMTSGYDININTASQEVLEAMRIAGAETLVAAREQDPFFFKQVSDARTYIDTSGGNLTSQSTVYKVYSYATVGGYTKQVEAIIDRTNASKPQVIYWRAL
jgi:type II secretory pathway component PulK